MKKRKYQVWFTMIGMTRERPAEIEAHSHAEAALTFAKKYHIDVDRMECDGGSIFEYPVVINVALGLERSRRFSVVADYMPRFSCDAINDEE